MLAFKTRRRKVCRSFGDKVDLFLMEPMQGVKKEINCTDPRFYIIDDNAVISHIDYKIESTQVYLGCFNTRLSHQNKGYGKKLLGEICRVADKFGVTLALHMHKSRANEMDWLYQFYCKMGFKRVRDTGVFETYLKRTPKSNLF